MSETTGKLINDIIEVVLDDVSCQHRVDHDEDGAHTSVEYDLCYEAKIRDKILALLEPRVVTEEWVEEKAKEIHKMYHFVSMLEFNGAKDFIRSIIEEITGK